MVASAADTLSAARVTLEAEGFAVIPDALTPAECADVHARLLHAVEQSEADGVPTRGYPFDPDVANQRVFHLFNYDPVFVDLIQRPLALEFVHALLGPDFLISNFSANITAPGSGPMPLHADQGYALPPWPERPLACNVAWILDDFTLENGATRYVPRSHRRGHGPLPGEEYETVPIFASAGSILVMDGRLWHRSGSNSSKDCHRAALFGYYVLRWLRPQINWNAALWPEVAATLDPRFLDLLGFYTGNVEFQVRSGNRGAVRAPEALAARHDPGFALGNKKGD